MSRIIGPEESLIQARHYRIPEAAGAPVCRRAGLPAAVRARAGAPMVNHSIGEFARQPDMAMRMWPFNGGLDEPDRFACTV